MNIRYKYSHIFMYIYNLSHMYYIIYIIQLYNLYYTRQTNIFLDINFLELLNLVVILYVYNFVSINKNFETLI